MEQLKKITSRAYSSQDEFSKIAEQLYEWGQRTYQEQESALASKTQSKERQWLIKMLDQGTASDKISAIAQLVASQPKHPLKFVNSLLKKCQTTNKKLVADAVQALKECFVANLLPNRKLLGFKEALRMCELSSLKSSQIVALYTEDRLRDMYYTFVQILEKGSRDTLTHFRKFMMRVQMDLLVSKPERQELLLSNIINKLGSPEPQICIHALQLIEEILKRHGNMAAVILREIDVFMKGNSNQSASFYGFQLLSNIKIPGKDPRTLSLFFKICFDRFAAMVKHNQLKSKTVSVLLAALNKKLPFVDRTNLQVRQFFEERSTELFKLSHQGSFSLRVHSLHFISQLVVYDESIKAQFYRALYELLLDPQLRTASKLSDFFTLLENSLERDSDMKRVKAFAKRILQVCLISSEANAAALLCLLIDLFKKCEKLRLMLTEEDEEAEAKQYDPKKRDPRHAAAESSSLAELVILLQHFHPSVSRLVKQIVTPDSDFKPQEPEAALQTFSAINFLDKFSYKQPKSQEKRDNLRRNKKHRSTLTEDPPNLKYAQQQDSAPADQEFYARYFEKKPKREVGDDDEELSDLADKAVEEKIKQLAGGDSFSEGEEDEELDEEEGLFEGVKGLKEVEFESEEQEDEKETSMFADLQEFEDLLDQEEISPELFARYNRKVGKKRKAR